MKNNAQAHSIRYPLQYLAMTAGLLLVCGFFRPNLSWSIIDEIIDRNFPAVQHIDVDTLKELLDQKNNVILIDVRKNKEFRISHLPGAHHLVTPRAVTFEKNLFLVVYCSVGIRSAGFAQKLTEQGYTNVRNLRGSIFEWANKGYPLTRVNQPVTKVHPYNPKWGSLLRPDLHQYELIP